MLMCTRCKKRPAVVFVSNGLNGQDPQGLCLVCAKELGIKPVNDIWRKWVSPTRSWKLLLPR